MMVGPAAARRRRTGFTLMELMVSLAVMGTITTSVTYMLSQQGHVYQVVDDVTEVQQSVRAISDLIEREARATGFMVPEAAAFCGNDSKVAPDALYVTDASPLNTGSKMAGVEITGGYSGTGTETLTVGSLILDGVAFYDTDGNGVADSDFQIGGGVIIADSSDSSVGTSCGVVASLPSATSIRVNFTGGGEPIAPGGDLIAVPAHVYTVDGNRQLLRDGMVLTHGVEDLQFALFYDLDDDGLIDANSEDPGATAFAGSYQSDNWDNELLAEIRVSIVAVSRATDPQFSEGHFQQTENRGAVAGKDGFRRRVFTASIRPRNVGQRGGM